MRRARAPSARPCAGLSLGYAESLSGALHDYRRVLLLLLLSLLALLPVYLKARRRSKQVGLLKRDVSEDDDGASRLQALGMAAVSFRRDRPSHSESQALSKRDAMV